MTSSGIFKTIFSQAAWDTIFSINRRREGSRVYNLMMFWISTLSWIKIKDKKWIRVEVAWFSNQKEIYTNLYSSMHRSGASVIIKFIQNGRFDILGQIIFLYLSHLNLWQCVVKEKRKLSFKIFYRWRTDIYFDFNNKSLSVLVLLCLKPVSN